jgi:hypothetical protein
MARGVVSKGKINFTPCRVAKGRPGAGTFTEKAKCGTKAKKRKPAKKRKKPAKKRKAAKKKKAKRRLPPRGPGGKFRKRKAAKNGRRRTKKNIFRAKGGRCMRRLKDGRTKFVSEKSCKRAGV